MRAFLFAGVSAFLLLCNIPVGESSSLRAGARTDADGIVLKGAPRKLKKGKVGGDSGGDYIRGDEVKGKKGNKGGQDNNGNGGGSIPDRPLFACAGLTGIACPEGMTCVDNPNDCSIAADCLGICIFAPPSCGGFLGEACPDGLICVDDESDGCDPNNGGADCPGVCVEDKGGVGDVPMSCGGLVPVGSSFDCPAGMTCVDDPNNCGLALDCPGICVSAPQTCGGIAGLSCPDGLTCVDDGSDDCDPNNGGADCSGICVFSPNQGCGGLTGLQCPANQQCIDDPTNCGLAADCLGICVDTCGGFLGLACAEGFTCDDNPYDDCDPNNGGADCGGICVVSTEPVFSDLCPPGDSVAPQNGDECTGGLIAGEQCAFGKVCCCGSCYPETTCTCTDGDIFECATIAIKCSADCPPDGGDCPSQSSWPDLVGQTGTDAQDFIESSEPCLEVFIIPEGSFVTTDYRETRVRIYVDTDGIVVATPVLG